MTETIKRKANKEQRPKREQEPMAHSQATVEQLAELQKHFNENYHVDNKKR